MPKTVQLSEDAYGTLAALKRPGESFSDTVLRLAAARKDPRALKRLVGRGWSVAGLDYETYRRRAAQAEAERFDRVHGAGAWTKATRSLE